MSIGLLKQIHHFILIKFVNKKDLNRIPVKENYLRLEI